jgi:polysaccharide export outer membrane protein
MGRLKMRLMRFLFALSALLATATQPVFAQVAGVEPAPPQAPAAQSSPPSLPFVTQPVATQSTSATSTDGYQIGPEDVVEIDVLGQKDFASRVKVKSDGTIPLPFLGNVQAAGFTAISLAQSVASRLKVSGIFADPVVNVEIVSYASRYIIALGEVGAPGLVPVDRGYRLSEILARIGGIKGAGSNYVILTRLGQPEVKLLFENLAKGGEQDDPMVQPGDKIFVPKADLYYVSGAVRSPGEFPINQAGLTVRKALARAGGISDIGSEKKVKIFRDGREIKRVNLETLVQPGDSIVIGERLF